MLILPVDARFQRDHVAVATWVLIAINVVMFLLVGASREQNYRKALDYYVDSGLAAIEYPFYLGELTSRGETEQRTQLSLRDRDDVNLPIANLMLSDHQFQARLDEGVIVLRAFARYGEWREMRGQLETMLDRAEGWMRLSTERPMPWEFITYQFAHADIGHLLGNMIFLVLVGQLVEAAVGAQRLVWIYLSGGVVSALSFLAFNWGQPSSLVGASGAVSAVMGAFCVLFNTRQVRFFYNILFVVGFKLLPALLLLPYWILWELIQWVDNQGAKVAYEAHLGGLLAGATFAYILRRYRKEREFSEARLDQSGIDERYEQSLHRASRLLMDVQLDGAAQILWECIEQHPQDVRPWRLLFTLAQINPRSEHYHRLAAKLLALKPENAEVQELIDSVKAHYLSANNAHIKLPEELVLRLFAQAVTALRFDDCDRLLGALTGKQRRDPRVIKALNLLGQRAPDPQASRYRQLASSTVA